jgi:prophage DNA circulation protein
MPDTVFRQYPTASWTAKGKRRITFAIESIQESGGNRLVPHERARRNGAKYDDTGSSPRTFSITSPFYVGCEDPGVDPVNYYPRDLNDLIDSFRVHEVGDLVLPPRGPIRARLQSYTRAETFAERDYASVAFVFVEDNEDGVLTSSFVAPSARSVASRYGEAVAFSLEQQGIPSTDFGVAIATLAAEIEDLAGQPFEYMQDLKTKATQVKAANDRILNAFGGGREDAGILLLDPVSAHVHRQIATLTDTTARVVAEKISALPRLKVVRFKQPVGMPQVAAKFSQDLGQLLAANPQIGNAFAIPAGTPVNVYVT